MRMNSRKKILYSIIFLFHFFLLPLCAIGRKSGLELCDELFNILRRQDFNPQIQNIVSKGQNQFPYNIVIYNNNLPEKNNENLILFFKLEEACNYRNILFDTLTKLKEEAINSTVIISYNEFSIPQIESTIKGSQVFIVSLNSNVNNYVYLINLSAAKNSFICGSKGKTAPFWMVKNVFTAYANQQLTKDLPLYYLSQYSKYSFLHDELLQAFLSNDIPAVKLDFHLDFLSTYKEIDKITNTILDLIDNYKNEFHTANDYHSFMFSFFNKSIWFSEYTIVKIILILTFSILFFVFFIGFINARLKNKAWTEIRNNWHAIPSTFTLLLAGFFAGKLFYFLANKIHPFSGTAFGIIILQILLSGALISIFYFFEMIFTKSYSGKSVDFLILITTLNNLLLFTIIDISLFPIFFAISIAAIISLIVKKNWTHIVLFIFIIAIFTPYIFYIYNYTDYQVLRQFFMHSNWSCILLPLVLLPLFLMLLRIFADIKKRFTQKRIFAIVISSTYLFFLIFFFTCNSILFTNNKTSTPLAKIIPDDSIAVETDYHDSLIFGNIIRSVKIKLPENTDFVEFTVSAQNENPVLYSDNEYEVTQKNTSSFLIPYNPPTELTFEYGSSDVGQSLMIRVYTRTDESMVYHTKEEKIIIESRQK